MKGSEKRYVYPHPHKRNLPDTEPDSLRKLFPARGGPLAAPSRSVPWAAGCCPSGHFYGRLAAAPQTVALGGWLLPLRLLLWVAGCCFSDRAVSSDFVPGVDAVSRRIHTPRLTPLTFVASQQKGPPERLS